MIDRLCDWIANSGLSFEDTHLFAKIVKKAAEFSESGAVMMWTTGNELLVEDAETANRIADALELLWGGCVHTGSYDIDEDIRGKEVDHFTGWHYVDFD